MIHPERKERIIQRHDMPALKEVFFNPDSFAEIVNNQLLILLEDEHGLAAVLPQEAYTIRRNLENSGTIGRSESFDSLVQVEYEMRGDKWCVIFTFPPSSMALSVLKRKYIEYFQSVIDEFQSSGEGEKELKGRVVQRPKGFKNMSELERMSDEVFAEVDKMEATVGHTFVIYSAVDTTEAGPLFNRVTMPFIERLIPKRKGVILKLCRNKAEALEHVFSDTKS